MSPAPKDRSKETPPSEFPEVNPKASDMGMYSTQILFEMQHSLGRIESQLSNLDRTVNDVDSRLRSIESNASWVKGALACAVVLIPVCFGIIWWSLGERIEGALRLNAERTIDQTSSPQP